MNSINGVPLWCVTLSVSYPGGNIGNGDKDTVTCAIQRFSSHSPCIIVISVLALCSLVAPAQTLSAEDERELRREIEEQQQEINGLRQQIDELRRLLLEHDKQIESRSQDAEREEVPASAGKPAAKPAVASTTVPLSRKAPLSQMDKHDKKHPTGSNFGVSDHTKTIPIPSISTEIGLHGFVEMQIIHDANGLDDNEFDTARIPVDGSPSQTKFNVNPSRLEISSKTDIPGGKLNTFFSMDLNGQLDSPDPRLREAYGEIIVENWAAALLAGQAFATMLDLKAAPETLDFAGPAGAFDIRQPLLRVTKVFKDELRLDAAVETPENVAYINADTLTRLPDFAVAASWHPGGKYLQHLRVAGLVRDLRAEGNDGSTDSAVGWAINGSGKAELPFLGSRDNFRFNVNYGDGYGAQIKGGPDDAAFDPGSLQLSAIGVLGVDVGLQHGWSNLLRSNLVFGYVKADNPDFVGEDQLDSTMYTALNLIWNPYEPLTFGAEWLWGQREDRDGASGTDNRFLASSKFDF